MKLNYKVRILLRKDKIKNNGTCPLYIFITLNGKRLVKLSTGESIESEFWDSRNQRFLGKGNATLFNHVYRSVIDINDFIGDLKQRGKVATKDDIVSFYKKEDTQCFYKYFDEVFCENKLPTLAISTKESYLLLRKRLKEFKPLIRLNDIDLKFITDFNQFLRTKKKTGKGGIWNRNKNLRTVIKFAYDLDLIENYPYKKYKLDKPKSKSMALNLDELNAIASLDVSHNKRLTLTKDKFLFSCYTGLRFGDVTKLQWNDIKNDIISITQEKTKGKVIIPLVKEAKVILKKYEDYSSIQKTIFKVVSNQKTNKGLKELAEMAGVDKKVSFHIARHTFGTILGKDQNAFTIMKLMGHKKISTSAIYVNTDVATLKATMQNVTFGLSA